MARYRRSSAWLMAACLALLSGCALSVSRHEALSSSAVGLPPARPASGSPPEPQAGTIRPISLASEQTPGASIKSDHAALPIADDTQSESSDCDCVPSDPFNGQTELTLETLVTAVQARNPSLQAASDAWRAATERYPQMVSLDDPMFEFMISPSGVGRDNGGGWMVQGSQKIPWAGKRALRGSLASAEADVMQGDIGDTRLRLEEAAKTAFYDYYLAHRQTEVNAATQKLVQQLREIAAAKYQVNQVGQQDVLQADVELADLATRTAELKRDQQVATARINTLLHRAADHPLPPPPVETPLLDRLPAAEELQQAAVRARPDLYAQLSRIQVEEANLQLACQDYYPDLDLVARYDGFMPEEMRPQVGMNINIPIRHTRRSAALREASHRIAQRRAEYENLLDQVQYDVQAAYTQLVQAAEVVRLYREQTIPASQRSLEAAQASYTTGTLDFLRLLDTERQLNEQREKYYAAIAEYHRRLAELERAVGEPVR